MASTRTDAIAGKANELDIGQVLPDYRPSPCICLYRPTPNSPSKSNGHLCTL